MNAEPMNPRPMNPGPTLLELQAETLHEFLRTEQQRQSQELLERGRQRAEEILRNIAENEAADTLRNAALETLRLYRLPAEPVIVPPLPANPAVVPMNAPSGSTRAPRTSPAQ